MKRVFSKDLSKQLKMCGIGTDSDSIESTPYLGVCHKHDWDHGYETVYGFNGTRREFYADLREMYGFLMDYFSATSITELIIAPFYRYDQFDKRYYNTKEMPGMDIFKEIRGFLLGNGVRKGDKTGIKLLVLENTNIIEMILEGSFRGVSELCLFSHEHQVLIEPHHHFDLFFWSQNIESNKEVITDILIKHPSLRCFERQAT